MLLERVAACGEVPKSKPSHPPPIPGPGVAIAVTVFCCVTTICDAAPSPSEKPPATAPANVSPDSFYAWYWQASRSSGSERLACLRMALQTAPSTLKRIRVWELLASEDGFVASAPIQEALDVYAGILQDAPGTPNGNEWQEWEDWGDWSGLYDPRECRDRLLQLLNDRVLNDHAGIEGVLDRYAPRLRGADDESAFLVCSTLLKDPRCARSCQLSKVLRTWELLQRRSSGRPVNRSWKRRTANEVTRTNPDRMMSPWCML